MFSTHKRSNDSSSAMRYRFSRDPSPVKVKSETFSDEDEWSSFHALCDVSSEAAPLLTQSHQISQYFAPSPPKSSEHVQFHSFSNLFEDSPLQPDATVSPSLDNAVHDPLNFFSAQDQDSERLTSIQSDLSSFTYLPPSLATISVESTSTSDRKPYYRAVTVVETGSAPSGRLYIGEEAVVTNLSFVDVFRVFSVLCLSKSMSCRPLRYSTIKTIKYAQEKLELCKSFSDSTNFLVESLSANRSVLICCESGQRRSACHLVAFLMRTQGITLRNALETFSNQAIAARLDALELGALRMWEACISNVVTKQPISPPRSTGPNSEIAFTKIASPLDPSLSRDGPRSHPLETRLAAKSIPKPAEHIAQAGVLGDVPKKKRLIVRIGKPSAQKTQNDAVQENVHPNRIVLKMKPQKGKGGKCWQKDEPRQRDSPFDVAKIRDTSLS